MKPVAPVTNTFVGVGLMCGIPEIDDIRVCFA